MRLFRMIFCALCAQLLLCLSAGATTMPLHPYYFTQLDVRNGLSENNVKCIIQDSWGFMWFGTKNGLNRFDGVNIKHYDVDDLQKGMGNHNISRFFEDSERRLWIGTDRGVYVFDPMTERFSHFDKKTPDGKGVTNWIAGIDADTDGNMWIISPDEGAFRYNMNTQQMSVYADCFTRSGVKVKPECVCVRANGEVWIGTEGAGIFRYDAAVDKFHQVLADRQGKSLDSRNIFAICDYGDLIAVGEHEGCLFAYNPNTNELTELCPEANYKIIRSLVYTGKELFVGTQEGLFIIADTGEVTHIKEEKFNPYGLSDNIIYSLYCDRDNGIWLGTGFSGVNYMPRKGIVFRNFIPNHGDNSLTSRCLRDIQTDSMGRPWIASERGTLHIYDKEKFIKVNVPTYKGGENRLSLMAYGDKMWSGVFKNGLDVIDIKTFQVKHYSPSELGLSSEGSVYSLCRDQHNNVWMGTGAGLYFCAAQDLDKMKFTFVEALGTYWVHDILQDTSGWLWIASMGNGIMAYNPETGETRNILPGKDGSGLLSNSLSSLTFDQNGNIWFSTDRGGICKLDPKTMKTISYSTEAGLPDDVAYKILEDKKGNLWFGTNQGLVRFNDVTHNVTIYRNTNGLVSNQYSYKSAIELNDGTFLFGGVEGLVSFNPLLATSDTSERRVHITNVRVNDRELRPSENGIIQTNILHSDKIVLPNDISSIAFDISSLLYSGVERDSYEYMLEGVDKTWMKCIDRNSIFYSQLQPGNYTLRVRITGDKTNETKFSVIIKSPWYATIWAYLVYALLFFGIAISLYWRMRNNQIRNMARKEERYKEAKDKEVLNAKISFFTDVTHEIRTPLTLIKGSVENIIERPKENSLVEKNIFAIHKNCNRLLNLVNQLLDFRKVNMNTMTMYFTKVDICSLISAMVERFEPSIVGAGKQITLTFDESPIVIPMDKEAVTKIMSNLLNNARKYSDTFIRIHVGRTANGVEVEVINDGDRIPNDKKDEIFTPFVRLNEAHTSSGSGIGLPLARSLAELHNGSLNLDTQSDYNRFVLVLPASQENVVDMVTDDVQFEADIDEMVIEHVKIETDASEKGQAAMKKSAPFSWKTEKDLYTLLIAEDNEELNSMLVEKFTPYYNIISVSNGQEALNKIRTTRIDLVVSDILMPVMDGMKLTEQMKSDIEINHIPIVLLTARGSFDFRMEGLKAGADAYIEKPFSFTYLHQQVETLLSNRRRERESFVHKPYLPVQNSNINKHEEEFLKKVSELIIAHIREPEFNVERLASEMCMSRSSLHRKIKELSNMTPIDFIRLIRLKKAGELIREYNYHTNEVCEMVGITSPSYFIKLFSKQFGMTPKEFASGKDKS